MSPEVLPAQPWGFSCLTGNTARTEEAAALLLPVRTMQDNASLGSWDNVLRTHCIKTAVGNGISFSATISFGCQFQVMAAPIPIQFPANVFEQTADTAQVLGPQSP